jgi:hypothetical protein
MPASASYSSLNACSCANVSAKWLDVEIISPGLSRWRLRADRLVSLPFKTPRQPISLTALNSNDEEIKSWIHGLIEAMSR